MEEWVGRMSNGMFGLLLVLIFFAVQTGWKWLAKQLASKSHIDKSFGQAVASMRNPKPAVQTDMNSIAAKLSRLLAKPSILGSSVAVLAAVLFATIQMARQEEAFFQLGKQVIEFTSLERCHHYVKTRSPNLSEQAIAKVCFLK